jgi:hypothetical protein
MTTIHNGRYTADIEGDFAVFLIGMRINRLRAIRKWLPVARAMSPMIAELEAHPELGYLSAENFIGGRTTLLLSYWRSFDHLEAYARGKTHLRLPAWKQFNRAVGNDGSVGIWHETFTVRQESFETVYGNMPRFGLARAGLHLPATGHRRSARGRHDSPDKITETFGTINGQKSTDKPMREGELTR